MMKIRRTAGDRAAATTLPTSRRRQRRRRSGEENSGTLDADGKLQITIPTKVDNKKQDLVYRIEARVTDAGNREIAGHGFALATYGSFFLTAEPNSYVYSKGNTATINVTAQDYDKKPVQTAFRVEMNRWNWRKGAGQQITTIAGPDRRQRQGAGASSRFPTPASSACASAPRLRRSATSRPPRTCGRPGQSPWWSGTDEERIQIVADKKSYQPGETAHVLIVTGKEPASVLVTAEGQRSVLRTGYQEQRRQHRRRCARQAGVRAELLCRRGLHSRQQAV